MTYFLIQLILVLSLTADLWQRKSKEQNVSSLILSAASISISALVIFEVAM